MRNINKYIAFLTLVCSPACLYAASSNGESIDDKILQKYVPDLLKTDVDTGAIQSLDDGIRVFSYAVKLNGDKQDYIVLQYFDRMDRCSIRVLKKDRASFTLAQETILQSPTIVNGCLEIEQVDLDLDGKPELLVSTMFGKEVGVPAILSWNGRQLVDITPVETKNGKVVNKFRQMTIASKPIGKSLVIIDVDSNDKFAKKRIYRKQGQSIKLEAEYDFVSYVPAGDQVTVRPEFQAEGSYVLEADVLSDHQRAVRAEVIVNGSKALSPQDFCATKQPDKKDKNKWSGHDDDDDMDFDRCKRCTPKKDVYTVVTLKKNNEIKVKVNGRRDSVMRLTLTKK